MTTAGTYTATITNSNGCDSVVTLTLQTTSFVTGSISATICNGSSYNFNNQTLTTAGTYRDTLTAQGGCDSIVTLNLSVTQQANTTINAAICVGTTYTFNNLPLSATGTYFESLTGSSGCDSIVTLNLVVNSFITNSSTVNICHGGSYQFFGRTLTNAGTYTVTISNNSGSVTSAPVTLTASSISAGFTLVPDTTTPHHWFVINNCTGPDLQYEWNWGDNTSWDTVANPVHTYAAAGYYNICVLLTDLPATCFAIFCDSSNYVYRGQGMISMQVIPGTANGINDISANASVKVYPNPSTGTMTIETAQGSAQSATIYDAVGRALRDINITSPKTTIDLNGLSDGIYTLSLKNGRSSSIKFVISR